MVDGVTEKILSLIYKWHEALSLHNDATYQEEFKTFTEALVYLTKKGFPFPTYISKEDLMALRPPEGLKSKEELSKARRVILEAKLHEMIRRKKQREANAIIKDMTGYNIDEREDFTRPFLRELGSLRDDAMKFDQLMDDAYIIEYGGFKESSLGVLEEYYMRLQSASEKIQRILATSFDDPTRSSDLTELESTELIEANDYLCQVSEKFLDPFMFYTKGQETLIGQHHHSEFEDQDEVGDLLQLDGSSEIFSNGNSRSNRSRPTSLKEAQPSLLDTDVPDLLG